MEQMTLKNGLVSINTFFPPEKKVKIVMSMKATFNVRWCLTLT